MVMMLPFLAALLAVIFAWCGLRRTTMVTWLVLFMVLAVWLNYHATSSLGLAF